MKKRVAIVTGGSRGIGRACAAELAARGADIVISYRNGREAAEETARLCRERGASVLLVRGDVGIEEDCAALVKAAIDAFGSVDILVNNAGITKDGLLMTMSGEDFEAVIDTNLKGSFFMMKAVSRPMLRNKYGRIVNISSVVGLMGNAGQANYAASKAGIIGLTKSFAKEVAKKGITVNAVAPGFIETDMTAALGEKAASDMSALIPLGEIGRPEDIASAVGFLAGEEAGYITGQVISVDGGMSIA